MKKMSLNALKSSAAGTLSREQMKQILGGERSPTPGGGGGKLCMGCTTNQECAAVGKGSCVYYPGCQAKCCSGWQSC